MPRTCQRQEMNAKLSENKPQKSRWYKVTCKTVDKVLDCDYELSVCIRNMVLPV